MKPIYKKTPTGKEQICCGDHMTMEEFVDCCRCGGFIDYDGYGYYATEDMKTDRIIRPSDVMSGIYDRKYTHVLWFNR